MKRVGVIGIIIQNKTKEKVMAVQNLLSEYGSIIVGRMGIPIPENGICAISLIVKGDTETISALNGKLGRIDSVNVKSALNAVEVDE